MGWLKYAIEHSTRKDWQSMHDKGPSSHTFQLWDDEVPSGALFLCDVVGNQVNLCIKTARSFRSPGGRMVPCKVLETLVEDCHSKFGTALNGEWIVPKYMYWNSTQYLSLKNEVLNIVMKWQCQRILEHVIEKQEFGEPMDSMSWGYQEGYIMKTSNASRIGKALELVAELIPAIDYILPHLDDLKTENFSDPSVGIFKDEKLDKAIDTIKRIING